MRTPIYTFEEGDATVEVHSDHAVKILPCGTRVPYFLSTGDDDFETPVGPPKIHTKKD